MAINVDITRRKNESTAQTIRRFVRKFRDTGIVREIRSRRYHQRADSTLRRKRSAIARITMGKYYAKERKLGNIEERRRRY